MPPLLSAFPQLSPAPPALPGRRAAPSRAPLPSLPPPEGYRAKLSEGLEHYTAFEEGMYYCEIADVCERGCPDPDLGFYGIGT